ncbi:MAG: hypothetical protein PHC61_08875 [Chitinivibrionales bacterium]|nr:hypothetical protein [Chitinivibrionales bacterium]
MRIKIIFCSCALIATAIVLPRANEGAAERHKPVAASIGDIDLYWQRNRGLSFPLDTVGLDRIERKLCNSAQSDSPDLMRAAAFLADHGKTLYRLENPQSIALALLIECGFSVIVLTQLAGNIAIATAMGLPTQAAANQPPKNGAATPADLFGQENSGGPDTLGNTSYKQMRILSDFLWQSIDTGAIVKIQSASGDYAVRLATTGLGYCEFLGKEDVTMSSKNIRDISGFTVRDRWLTYQTDGQVSRLFLKIYLCVDRELGPAAVKKRLEAKMDALNLDLSCKVPALAPVLKK